MTPGPAAMVAAYYLAAFVVTLLLTRAALWALRKWNGGTKRLLAAHGLVWVAVLLMAVTHHDGGPQTPAVALAVYAPPLVLWLVMDLWRHRRRRV